MVITSVLIYIRLVLKSKKRINRIYNFPNQCAADNAGLAIESQTSLNIQSDVTPNSVRFLAC